MLATAVAAATLAARGAVAGDGAAPPIDFAPLLDVVGDRAALGPARDRPVYERMRRILRTRSRVPSLQRDIARLVAVSAARRRLFAPDGELDLVLERAADAADAAVARRVDAVERRIDEIGSEAARRRVETIALDAYERHRTVRSLRGAGVHARLTGLLSAARRWHEALQRGWRAIVRQHGPAPQAMAARAGSVYTVVGTGAGGFNGDGRPARRTSLYFANEIRFGPDGLLHVLDWNNHRLRRVEADGTVTTLCGSGTPGDSEGDPAATELNHPSAVVFEPGTRRVFIAAWHNHKVKCFDPDAPGEGSRPGKVFTIAGGPQGSGGNGLPATQARFNLLPGIARLSNGDLLVTDAGNQVVRRIRMSAPVEDVNVAGVTVTTGAVEHFAGTQGVAGVAGDGGFAADAELSFSAAQNAEPDGRMETDADDNVYVVCTRGHVVRKIAPDGRISTFAGTGAPGYAGDGGPADEAELRSPSDVAIARDGTVFISDSDNHVIRRVAPDGTISTFAGDGVGGFAGDGGPARQARFLRPDGLELDAAGNLWIADRYNNRIRVVAGASQAGLFVPLEPYRLPLPSRGTPPAPGASGTIDTIAGIPGELGFNGDDRPSLDTLLYWPQDLAVDPQHGLVHFLDWNNHRVRRVEADGTVTTIAGSGELGDTTGPAGSVRLNHPTDVAFHPLTGELWIAAWHTDKVLRLRADVNEIVYMAGAKRAFSGDGGAPAAAQLNLPSSVKFDAAGNWYVCDQGNRRVRFVDAALDRIETLCGTGFPGSAGDGGPAALANLSLPGGQSAQPGGRVCLSSDGRWLYVAESDAHRVRRIDLLDPDRTITTFAGTGAAGWSGDGGDAAFATLRFPSDVDCDAYGNVYVADAGNHVVRRIDADSRQITTLAGTGTRGFGGDGGPAHAAQLDSPSGIFVDRATGRVYVADTYNSVLRVIWE